MSDSSPQIRHKLYLFCMNSFLETMFVLTVHSIAIRVNCLQEVSTRCDAYAIALWPFLAPVDNRQCLAI